MEPEIKSLGVYLDPILGLLIMISLYKPLIKEVGPSTLSPKPKALNPFPLNPRVYTLIHKNDNDKKKKKKAPII